MANVLITGANRGIGLELARRLVERGDRVFAGARQPEKADALRKIENSGRLSVIPLDVTDAEALSAAVRSIEGEIPSLDVLINNAGVYHNDDAAKKLGALREEPLVEAFRVNAVAPLLITQAFAPLLRKGTNPRVLHVSSEMGSIERKTSGGNYAYCISKAAFNMAARALAWDLKDDGIASVTLHPGWVRTDMGGPNAHLSVEQSAAGILKVLDKLTIAETGIFLDWQGETVAW